MTLSIVEAVLQTIQLVVVVDVRDLIQLDVSVIDCLFLLLDLRLEISDPVLFLVEVILQSTNLVMSIEGSLLQLLNVVQIVSVTGFIVRSYLLHHLLHSVDVDFL